MSKNVDLTSKEWCDLVFVGKNKEFGAYTTRINTPRRYNMAMVLIAVLVASVIFLPKLVSSLKKAEVEEEVYETVVEMTQLPEAEVEEQPEVTPQVELPPPPPLNSSYKITPPVIKNDEEVAEDREMKTQEELTKSEVNISIADVVGTDEENGQDIADFREVVTAQEEEEEEIHDFVEQMPQYPGGDAELLKYIGQNLKYPTIAQENGIQGKVILRFVVTKNGTVGDVQILRSLDPACDKEAVRVVKSLPQWIPGKQNGSAVAVWYTLTVTFKLM